MKKGLLLFTFISFLFLGNINLYSQETLENQNNIEISDKKVKKSQKELNQEIRTLYQKKLLTPSDDKESHKEIDSKIVVIKEQIETLIYLETEKTTQYLGAPIFDNDDFWMLIIKGIFNIFIILIIVRYIYYPTTKNKDYLFTFFLISLTVFLLCFLLENVKLELGFALGLFAIFGIIRYRTDTIPIKEMTYLFIVIGVSVINALANKKISHAELIFANLLIVFVTFGMERIWLLRHEIQKNITYEKIDLILPEKRQELIADLRARTGLDIVRVEIRRIDFLKDTASLRVFYYEDDSK